MRKLHGGIVSIYRQVWYSGLMRTIPYLHDFISELPDHIKEDISRLSTERTLSRGDAAYRKGDPPGEVFRLLEGAVKLCNYSLDGREMIAGEFRPGDCFGEMGVIDGLPLNRGDGGGDDHEDTTPGASGIAAIPKTGKSPRPGRGSDMEPNPAG